MPLRIALEDLNEGEGPAPTFVVEETLEEFKEGREESEILDFIVIEGKFADALDALCMIDDDGTMIEQFEDILGRVYRIGRSKK